MNSTEKADCLETGIFDPRKIEIVYIPKEYIEAGQRLSEERRKKRQEAKRRKWWRRAIDWIRDGKNKEDTNFLRRAIP